MLYTRLVTVICCVVVIKSEDLGNTTNPVEIITSSGVLVQSENSGFTLKNSTNSTSDPLAETPLVLQINDGKIEGRELRTIDNNIRYYAFQGIPYGEPPVEGLRFNDPVPAKPWDNILPTQEDEKKCIQIDNDFSGREDCLYVNVFTTSDIFGDIIPEENLKPVMVWIYGGYFSEGSSKSSTFGPDYFLEEEVVVVTFNYRLGVFGFLSTEDMAAPGNWGLKDQILALKWVQDNIKYFGGDPKNVTLFGQSAGAVCVSYLLQYPKTEGLFHKAILQSGTSLNPWSLTRNPKKVAYTLGKLLDIKTTNSTHLVEHLRKVEPRTLHYISATTDLTETLLHNPLDSLIFEPSVEPRHDKAVITERSHQLLKYGSFNRMPIMVGFNSQESIPFINIVEYLQPYLLTYDLFSTRLVPKDLNIENNLEKIMVAFQIRHKYFDLKPIVFSKQKLIQFVTDDQFVRPIHEFAYQVSKWAHPTYLYRFSYEGEVGSMGRKRKTSGVEHSEELNYMWVQTSNIQHPNDEDRLIRNRLVKLWTNFVKVSNPTPEPAQLFSNITWTPTSIKEMVYLDIGKQLQVSSNFSQYNIQFWKEIYQKHGKPPFDTY